MSGVRILGTGSSIPNKVISNDDLSKTLDTSDEWIYSRTGIKNRHIISEEESVHVLAVRAAEEALENAKKNDNNFSKDKITAVIVGTMTSEYVFPSAACIVQKELELPESVLAYDISAACTGFLYSMQTAYAMLNLQKDGYALIIGAECMSTVLDYTDRSSCVLFGDGAGAAVIGYDSSETAKFIPIAGTQGDIDILHCQRKPKGDGFLHMKGGTVYSFATTSLRGAIDKLFEMSGMTIDDIDMFVCHQANARIIDSVKKRYPGAEHKFFKNMEEFANTSAASVSIAFDDMYKKGLLKSGMTIITAAFGAGLSWNAVLMTI